MTPIDYRGFKFGNVHSSELHLEVVSTSNRYEARTLPAPTDTAVDIPGSDGQYYFGSVFKNREITVNVAFDNVSEQIYRKIRQLFATDKPQDLVFDEEPYKTWKAKLKAKPEFKSLCFNDDEGNRVYKGDGKLQFICYFPYAFGFDKYVVKAADYYALTPPEQILCELSNDEDDFYFASRALPVPAWIPADLRYHYNVNPKDDAPEQRDDGHDNKGDRYWNPNDGLSWKTGYPTIDQVQNGELYFDLNGTEKTLVTTRGYWDNIPEWQSTARLLTTPTLDYDQGLMYMPQYSKTNYINMEVGFDYGRQMIGTRLLVYNPGDLPVDWELKIEENQRGFWSGRGSERFRIRRFNVERLTIPQAVDWCGMKTLYPLDEEKYRYGNKYFARKKMKIKIDNAQNVSFYKPNFEEFEELNDKSVDVDSLLKQNILPADKNWGVNASIKYIYTTTDSSEEKETIYTIHNAILSVELTEAIRENHSSISPADLTYELKLKNIDYEIEGEPLAFQTFPYNIRYNIDNWTSRVLESTINTYEYSDYNVVAPTLKDDELLRQSSEGTTIENPIKPISPTVAFNLHLGSGDSGAQLLDNNNFEYVLLEEAHPKYCYYAEPIPRQKLGDFIRLFYWQSKQLIEGELIYEDEALEEFQEWVNKNFYLINEVDYDKGIALADRYDEVLKQCVTDEEEFELYWDTLKQLFKDYSVVLNGQGELIRKRINDLSGSETREVEIWQNLLENLISTDDLFYEYVNTPLEYVSTDSRELNYKEEVFNAFKYPTWMTEDYLEIDSTVFSGVRLLMQYFTAIGSDVKSLFLGQKVKYDSSKLVDAKYQSLKLKLDKLIGDGNYLNYLLDDCYYLNSDTRMLYTLEEPKGNEFNYKPSKIIMNEAIVKGKWFKIPPGWSMITIEPVMDSDLYGGKRWLDSRPFNWGYGGDENHNQKEVSQLFDYIYDRAEVAYWRLNYYNLDVAFPSEDHSYPDSSFQFNKWYQRQIDVFSEDVTKNLFLIEYYHHKRYRAEQEFLSIIADFWEMLAPYYTWTARKGVYKNPDYENVAENGVLHIDPEFDANGNPIHCITGNISDWWWYACNYMWANFPPIYWTAADMLNNIKIKYTPLFY